MAPVTVDVNAFERLFKQKKHLYSTQIFKYFVLVKKSNL